MPNNSIANAEQVDILGNKQNKRKLLSPSPKLPLATASVRDLATSPMVDRNSSPMKTPKKVKMEKI